MDRGDYSALLTWARTETWAMEAGALETMASTLITGARGQPADQRAARAQVAQRRRAPGAESAVAVIPVVGVITYKRGLFSLLFGGTAIVDLIAEVNAAAADPRVKGILIPVDSPGGGVSGLIEAATALRAAHRRKPVVAAVDPLAASAAFWLAAQASEIVITPSGRTGSLGVFALHLDFSEQLKQVGVKPTFIASTPEKVELSGAVKLSDPARAAAQREVDLIYAAFLADVARGRGQTVARVRRDFGRGRLLNAQDAVAVGLVDRIGTIEQATAGVLNLLSPPSPARRAALTRSTAPLGGAGPRGPGSPAPPRLSRRRRRLRLWELA